MGNGCGGRKAVAVSPEEKAACIVWLRASRLGPDEKIHLENSIAAAIRSAVEEERGACTKVAEQGLSEWVISSIERANLQACSHRIAAAIQGIRCWWDEDVVRAGARPCQF